METSINRHVESQAQGYQDYSAGPRGQLRPRGEDMRMRCIEVMIEAIAMASEAIKEEKKRKGD